MGNVVVYCNEAGIDWAALAAWVQAIGSIAAIFAAWWLSNQQHGRDRQLDADRFNRERNQLLGSASAIVTEACTEIEQSRYPIISESSSDAIHYACLVSEKKLELVLGALNELPAHSLGDSSLAKGMIRMRGHVADALETLRSLGDPEIDFVDAGERLNTIRGHAEEVREEFDTKFKAADSQKSVSEPR